MLTFMAIWVVKFSRGGYKIGIGIAVIKAVPDYQKLHSDASGMTTARQIGKWSKVELE